MSDNKKPKLNLRGTLLNKKKPIEAIEEPKTHKVAKISPREIDRASKAILEASRSKGTKKLTIEMDIDLHKKLKAYSVDREISIKDYIAGLIIKDMSHLEL